MPGSVRSIRLLGRVYGMMGMVMFSAGFFLSKQSMSGGFENALIRGLISVIAIFVVTLKTKEPLFTSHESLHFTLLRTIIYAAGVICVAFATKLVKASVFVVVSRTKALLYNYEVWLFLEINLTGEHFLQLYSVSSELSLSFLQVFWGLLPQGRIPWRLTGLLQRS